MKRIPVRKDEAGAGGPRRLLALAMLLTYISALSPQQLFAAPSSGEWYGESPMVTDVEEKAEALISAAHGGKIVLGDASIEIPEGALKEDTVISITRLARVEDTGESLYNAVPKSGGYRFLPAGTKFEKDVTITLPYSAELNSKPQSLEDMYTYFFDTEKKSWVKLERLEVDKEKHRVRSLSSHFTDMINATLTLPETAGPADVNLNSIKNLEAAKPDGHLIKFNPPEAGNTGDASFSFGLGIPSGRGGMEPRISIGYSSGSGNGIMGRGFDINCGSLITTDTRKGLPNYDTHDTYMLDGIPLEERTRDGTEIIYSPRKETSYNRIVRHGAGTDNDYWEITGKDGTRRLYGRDPLSCVGGGTKIFTWNLAEIKDVHGNIVTYEYEKSDGYVYPSAIYYTGFGSGKGNYSVKFHYDETRKDIRIDARSKEMVICRRLLTGITAHYKDEKALRTYTFKYDEGSAKEKMLSSIGVKNNADESYEYTFAYEDLELDENGNPIFFAAPVQWEGGKILNESVGKSIGGNVHASAGVGFGADAIDARGTGGATGSASTTTGYTKQTLVDIDGDGKCESVEQHGKTLRIYRQNSSGNGFEFDYEVVNLSAFMKSGGSFLMNEEQSSSNSAGWNVYGGLGSPGGLISAGYVYSSVTQDGSNTLYTGFYDMDGDGLVDIVTGTDQYLHNDTKEGSATSFSPRTIKGYPETASTKMSGTQLSEYRKSYALQRPFAAWEPLYDGTVKVRSSHKESGAFDVLRIYGDDRAGSGSTMGVEHGKPIYFVPDTGDGPKQEELEKEIDWDNTVEYTEAKVFGRTLEMPVFFPPEKVAGSCDSVFNQLYDPVYDQSGKIASCNLKKNFNELLDEESTWKLMENGTFVPGVLSEKAFESLKAYLNHKYSEAAEPKPSEEDFYRGFADAYTYSLSDRMFHLSGNTVIDRDFFETYIEGFVTKDNFGEIISCYRVNGIEPDLSGKHSVYRSRASASLRNESRVKNGSHAPGTSFVKDGRRLFSIGRIQGKDITIDPNGVIFSGDIGGKIKVKELKTDNCVLDVEDGKYTITYDFSDKIPYVDIISDEERNLIESKLLSKYPQNNLSDSTWNTSEPVEKEVILGKLKNAFVTDTEKQGRFISLVYDTKYLKEKEETKILYTRNSCSPDEAKTILRNAALGQIRGVDFPYYDGDNKLKSCYRNLGDDNSALAQLIKQCSAIGLFRYGNVNITIEYSGSALYGVSDGNVEFLSPKSACDTELVKKTLKLEFPDGKSSFSSKADFSTENLADIKSDLLLLYKNSGRSVSVAMREFLYGGKYGWFYGIWTGSEGEHPFTETNLLRVFRNPDGADDYKNYIVTGSVSDEDIKTYGKQKAKNVEVSVSPSPSYEWGCILPNKSGGRLEGPVSEYMEETVRDDDGVLKSDSRKVLSSPYIEPGKIRCARLGGNAYFMLDGIPENTASSGKVLQKTVSSGTDITSGPQVSIWSASLPTTETRNSGEARTVQTLQDVNSDRIPDVLKIEYGICKVFFGEADASGNISYPPEPSLTSCDIGNLAMNINESSSTGFSFSPSGAIQTIYNISGRQKGISLTNGIGGSTFSGTNSTPASMLDINADGIMDYVYYDEKTGASAVYLGSGDGFKKAFDYGWSSTGTGHVSGKSGNISFGKNLAPAGNDSSAAQDISGGVSGDVGGCLSISSSVQDLILMDMNGDGLSDVVRMAETQDDADSIIYEVFYNTGSKIEDSSPSLVRIPRWETENPGSLGVDNGAINSNKITSGSTSVNLDETADVDISEFSGDMESPGCSITASVSITGNLAVNMSLKIPVMTDVSVNITSNIGGGINAGSSTTSATVKMADLDGDGRPDHVLKTSDGIWWKRNLTGKQGLLNKITLPQGGSVQIGYAEKYGTRDNPNFKYVMSSVTMNDGADGAGTLPKVDQGEHSVTTFYEYDGGYYDRNEKDFFGFRTVRTTFADGTCQEDTYYNDACYSKGCIEERKLLSKDGILLSMSGTKLCSAPCALPRMEESWVYEKESGDSCIHTATEYEYDDFGNCIGITQDFGGGQKLSAGISYDNTNMTDYIVGLPVDIKVYGSNGQLLRHRAGEYDGLGQLVKLRQYYDSSSCTTNELSYDEYGNIIKVSDGRGAALSYEYDPDEHMFVTEITQTGSGTDSYRSGMEYDIPTQTKKSETDCRGNTMRYVYDGWQRVTEIFTAYDDRVPAVSYEYHTPTEDIDGKKNLWYAVTSNKVTFDAKDGSVIRTVVQVDGLGRAVRTAKTGCVNGADGWNASGTVEYDVKGRTAKAGTTEFIKGDLDDLLSSAPKMTSLFTSYEYDDRDRQILTTLPDGSALENTYYIEENRLISESTDPLGNISVQETDSRGNIVRAARKDRNGNQLTEVTYRYNEMGEMLNAFDAKGHPVSVEYDLLERRTALESLDSGRQEFFYDECSNLVRETNSVLRENNRQILYEYDGLNRLVKIDYPDTEDTVYTYGRANDTNGAAGKIRKIEDASGTLEYECGKLGEVTKETRTLTNHLSRTSKTETATMQYRSDYLGRMQWIVYPDGEKVTYGYDNGGQVTSVTGERRGHKFEYVTNILYDEYGQRTRIEYGNGTSTDYKYDPARRWLDTIKTQNTKGKTFQNITYSFDAVGNVLGYENDCLDSARGNYRTKQTYSYDDLYQLIKVDGSTTYNPYQSSVPEFKSTYSQAFEFDSDGLGNMVSKVSSETVTPNKSIGDNLNYSFNYTYDDNYAHRLVNVGERYYQYDPNGNVTAEQDGKFDGEESVTYHRITQEAENVFSTDYGWGLLKERSNGRNTSSAGKYRRTYTWDERNQLISSVDSNYSVSYVYGQDGQRSNKYTESSETLYFNKMWTLHTDSGNIVDGGQYAKNIYLGDTRIVTKLKGAKESTTHEEIYKQYFYHSDHLGSATLITDYNGDEYQRIEYTPYGETWVEKTQNTGLEYLPYKFTGKELDEETGVYYYGARYLSPKYSIWLSADPALGEYIPKAPINEEVKRCNQNLPGLGGIFNSVNLNLYHYAGNNPVKYTDPDGKVAGFDDAAVGILFIIGVTGATIAYMQTDAYKECSQNLFDAIANGIENTKNYIQSFFAAIQEKQALKAKAKELTTEIENNKSDGSYTIYFSSGKTYSGKGPLKRAIDSAVREGFEHGTSPLAIDWTPAPSKREAFKQEYIRIQKNGGPQGRLENGKNYNMIQSPGEKYFYEDYGFKLYPSE